MKLIDISTPKYPNTLAQVDDSDYDWLNQWKWTATACTERIYVRRVVGGKMLSMHRFIMNPPKDMVVDHIDGNTMNNQRGNLRVCGQVQNLWNQRRHVSESSKYKGVSFHKTKNKFQSRISVNGKLIHLGTFGSEIDAAMAHDEAAKKYHGEFAVLNASFDWRI